MPITRHICPIHQGMNFVAALLMVVLGKEPEMTVDAAKRLAAGSREDCLRGVQPSGGDNDDKRHSASSIPRLYAGQLVPYSARWLRLQKAFWMLVMLMQSASYNMRDSFLPSMPGLKLHLYSFDLLMQEHTPDVRQHIIRLASEADMSISPVCQLFAVEWFMCIFCSISLSFGLHVWDNFLKSGWPAVYWYALAAVRHHQAMLLQISDIGTAIQVLTSSKMFEQDMAGVISVAEGLRSRVNTSVLCLIGDMYKSYTQRERRRAARAGNTLEKPQLEITKLMKIVNHTSSRTRRRKNQSDAKSNTFSVVRKKRTSLRL